VTARKSKKKVTARELLCSITTAIPPETINQIDRRRRSFRAGNKEFSAAKCLVAWPNVCTTKELGGLEIKDFGTHNICLLLNLIHRLHSADLSAWANWIRERADIANMQGDNLGHHWELFSHQIATAVISSTDNSSAGRWAIHSFLD